MLFPEHLQETGVSVCQLADKPLESVSVPFMAMKEYCSAKEQAYLTSRSAFAAIPVYGHRLIKRFLYFPEQPLEMGNGVTKVTPFPEDIRFSNF